MVRNIFRAFLACTLFLGARAQAATPPAGSVAIVAITNVGNGCPQGSVASNISPDNLAFTTLFDSFVVNTTGSNERKANCSERLEVQVPAGWSFTVQSIDTRGYASLRAPNSHVSLSTQVRIGNVGRIVKDKLHLSGPYDDNFQIRLAMPANGAPWSDCSAQAGRKIVNIDTELKLTHDALAAVDSIDGELQRFTLAWKTCP